MILAELADPAPPLMGLDLFDGMMMVGFARQCDGVDGVETSRVTTQLSPSSPGAIPSRIPHLFIPQTCRANAFLTGKILFPLPSHRRVVLRCMFILCPQDVEQSALPSCGFKSKYVKSFRTRTQKLTFFISCLIYFVLTGTMIACLDDDDYEFRW